MAIHLSCSSSSASSSSTTRTLARLALTTDREVINLRSAWYCSGRRRQTNDRRQSSGNRGKGRKPACEPLALLLRPSFSLVGEREGEIERVRCDLEILEPVRRINSNARPVPSTSYSSLRFTELTSSRALTGGSHSTVWAAAR